MSDLNSSSPRPPSPPNGRYTKNKQNRYKTTLGSLYRSLHILTNIALSLYLPTQSHSRRDRGGLHGRVDSIYDTQREGWVEMALIKYSFHCVLYETLGGTRFLCLGSNICLTVFVLHSVYRIILFIVFITNITHLRFENTVPPESITIEMVGVVGYRSNLCPTPVYWWYGGAFGEEGDDEVR